MKNKDHLTESGFSKIIQIVEHMNLSRTILTSSLQASVNRKEQEDKT
jgi:hypothetical protein